MEVLKKTIGVLIIGAIVFVPPVMIFCKEGLLGVLIAYCQAFLFAGIMALGLWLISNYK